MSLFDRLRASVGRHSGGGTSRHGRSGPGSTLPPITRQPSVKPILPTVDLLEAAAFYRALGFGVVPYDEGYSWVDHCGWELFHLRVAPGLEPGASLTAVYIHVDDAAGWRAALAATGEAEIGPVADMPWGMREFSFVDPSGNVIRIGQNL